MNQAIKINWRFGNSSILAKYNGSPIINKGLIYISAGDNKNATLYSINANTGQEEWSFTSHSIYNDIFTSPIMYGENIYVVSSQGKLFSLNISTGYLNWEIEIETSILSFPLTSSPIATNGVVYIGSNNGYLYSFDANTGEKLWDIKITSDSIVNSPTIANDGKTICVETSDGCVHAINTATQKQKWVHTNEEFTLNFNGCIAIRNGIVYSGGNRTSFLAFDIESGELLWNFSPELSQAFTSPAIAGDIICLGNNNGTLWGIKPENGQIIWSYETITTWKNIAFGWIFSPVISNGVVYFGGRGYLRALELQTGRELWKYEAPASETLFLEPVNLISEIANKLGKILVDNPFSLFYSPLIINNLIYVVAKNGSYKRFLSLTVVT